MSQFSEIRIEKKQCQSECDSEIKFPIEFKHFPELLPKFSFFGLIVTFKEVSNNSNINNSKILFHIWEMGGKLLFLCIYRYYMVIFYLTAYSFKELQKSQVCRCTGIWGKGEIISKERMYQLFKETQK